MGIKVVDCADDSISIELATLEDGLRTVKVLNQFALSRVQDFSGRLRKFRNVHRRYSPLFAGNLNVGQTSPGVECQENSI